MASISWVGSLLSASEMTIYFPFWYKMFRPWSEVQSNILASLELLLIIFFVNRLVSGSWSIITVHLWLKGKCLNVLTLITTPTNSFQHCCSAVHMLKGTCWPMPLVLDSLALYHLGCCLQWNDKDVRDTAKATLSCIWFNVYRFFGSQNCNRWSFFMASFMQLNASFGYLSIWIQHSSFSRSEVNI